MQTITNQNRILIAFQSLKSQRVCCIKTTQSKNVGSDILSRRMVIQFIANGSVLSYARSILAAPVPPMIEPEITRTVKLDSGVRFQGLSILLVTAVTMLLKEYNDIAERLACSSRYHEIIEGEGSEAHKGDLVEFNYVCRRSNGYFVYSTVDQFSGESKPVILRLDQNQIIEGLKQVIIGMKVGGKRRALIPPSVGYINESLQPIPEEFGPRRSLLSHADEALVFEVQLLKVL